jgi:uncharacterized membrane protein
MIAYGQEVDAFVEGAIGKFVEIIINPIIILFAVVSLVVFIWGIIEFLAQGNSPEKASTGKRHMFWGIIGLFIFIASIGILRIISNTVAGPQILGN